MRKWILWSFGRGSFQYDVLCALILIVMFAIPPRVFNDRPGYMRIPDSGVVRVDDADGNAVYTVKVNADRDPTSAEAEARSELRDYLGSETPPDVFRAEAVYDTRGALAAYAFWVR